MQSTSKNVFNLNNEEDIQLIHDYLVASDSESDNYDENIDSDESDDLEARTVSSESEQDDESNDEDDNCKSSDSDFTAYRMQKGQIIETWNWNRKPFSRRKVGPHNILIKIPGVVGPVKGFTNILKTWSCLFDDSMINNIVTYTNQYISTIKIEFSRERDVTSTDATEIKAFIGLLYLLGVYRANRLNLDEIWSNRGDGIECFRLTMSQRRFRFLIRCLRFDDRESRAERKINDRSY